MYKTLPLKLYLSDEQRGYWLDQCTHSNKLRNVALYLIRSAHYERLDRLQAYGIYWFDDCLKSCWQTWYCSAPTSTYPSLYQELKTNEHYQALAAQSAQQTLRTVCESIKAYNALVKLYYEGQLDQKPKLPKYRKNGLFQVTFPKQALSFRDGFCYPSISRGAKDEVLSDIGIQVPDFIDTDWIKELTIKPLFGEFWAYWVIDDGKESVSCNEHLNYSEAIAFDHGGANWLTGVSTLGKSLIIDGRKMRSLNQGYCRLVAKYKHGKSDFYWDENLDRIQAKHNNQKRDLINKTARFIVNYCLNNQIGNVVFGWNGDIKQGSQMGKQNNQNFVMIPTKRLIDRVIQLADEYGIKVTVTEEAYTSKASFLDGDKLYPHGEKPDEVKFSGKRVKRGLYQTANGWAINADCNGAANILKKVVTQLGLNLIKVGRGALTLPNRYDLFTCVSKSYRKNAMRATSKDWQAAPI
ncbi:RNA-guided endonuclease TnpB family protein [Gloeocapsa sp. PCC 73106]|uniref:RNA-guided endonuclease InsQ/TnpB family protein n=1 Tax=Gloeocapsa sp. PCC 73106 TaxID=102232 RepID=UPI0002ABBA0E|nr:RNA-guided endonuclease TnpB family protein [Gloeocapsa sp. PCC 73106]ELR99146.1 transposase, IS605 OrfB family, central region [Gloeocapsa sp. PCC 73106]